MAKKHQHQFLYSILEDIASLPNEKQIVAALQKADKSVRAILRFCYGDFELALPLGPMEYEPINIGAFTRREQLANPDYDQDLLSAEAGRGNLTLFFVASAHKSLTDERRVQIWHDICNRLPAHERNMLDLIRTERVLPWPKLNRRVVMKAYGEDFLAWYPKPDAPPPPHLIVPEPAPNEPPGEPTQADILLSKIRWG